MRAITLNTTWARKLQAKLILNGVTRQELANELGVSKAYVSMLFNGRRDGGRKILEEAYQRVIQRRNDGS